MKFKFLLVLLLAIGFTSQSFARDRFTGSHPRTHKMVGGLVPVEGILINHIGKPTTDPPESHDQRTNYVTICNRSTVAAEVISVNASNPTTIGTVDWDCSAFRECDPQIKPQECAPFNDALLYQSELQSASGTPLVSVFHGRIN